jgi:hypothetical protein
MLKSSPMVCEEDKISTGPLCPEPLLWQRQQGQAWHTLGPRVVSKLLVPRGKEAGRLSFTLHFSAFQQLYPQAGAPQGHTGHQGALWLVPLHACAHWKVD